MMYDAQLLLKERWRAVKHNWSVAETALLNILKEEKVVERLDGRKSRNNDLFKQVFEKLKEAGINRSVEQIKKKLERA